MVRDCPPVSQTDPDLPPAAPVRRAENGGPEGGDAGIRFQGNFRRNTADEQATRAKERYFSPRGDGAQWDFRNQPPEFWNQFNTDVPQGGHLRIHPLLHWTEIDIWRYIERENIPVVPLYFSRNGKRYRSLGDKDITFPVESPASNVSEIITELETTRTAETRRPRDGP